MTMVNLPSNFHLVSTLRKKKKVDCRFTMVVEHNDINTIYMTCTLFDVTAAATRDRLCAVLIDKSN